MPRCYRAQLIRLLPMALFAMVLVVGCAEPSPQSPADHLLQGDLYFEQGDYQRAIAAYSAAVDGSDPFLRSLVYNNRGYAHVFQGDYRRAVDDFTSAIDLRSDFLQAHLNRAGAHFELAQYALALEDCTRAIELAPNDPGTYRNRARVYHALGQQDLAAQDEKRADELTTPPGERLP